MRILITGAQGLIGRYLAALSLGLDPEAWVLGVGRSPQRKSEFTHKVHWNGSALRAPLPADIRETLSSPRYQYQSVSLDDQARLTRSIRDFEPDTVVHLAAALRDDPVDALLRTNIGGSLSLLESIAAAGIKMPKVVLGSTGYLYGNRPHNELPRREDAPLAPIDLYGISKRCSEESTRLLATQLGIPVLWARIFNPVGPGQDERHFCGWIAMQIAEIACGIREPVIEVGSLKPTRDFIDVRDTARALAVLAESGEVGEIYNVASGLETSVESILKDLLRLSGMEDRIVLRRLPPRPTDLPRHYGDVTRLVRLGYAPKWPLQQSLIDLLEYYADDVAAASKTGAALETHLSR